MCRYTQGQFSCGHKYAGMALGEGALTLHKCIFVKVALEYWHCQPRYLPVEATTGGTISCPRACPLVASLSRDTLGNQALWAADRATLQQNMLAAGVTRAEQARILDIEGRGGMDSMRKPERPPTQNYPPRYYNAIKDLEVYQSIPYKAPNLEIMAIDRGCGCWRDGIISSPCLKNWPTTEILMCRMIEWNAAPWTRERWLNYGDPGHPETRDRDAGKINTIFKIPVSDPLRQVLQYLDPRGLGLSRGFLPLSPPFSAETLEGPSTQEPPTQTSNLPLLRELRGAQLADVEAQDIEADNVEAVNAELSAMHLSEANLFDLQ